MASLLRRFFTCAHPKEAMSWALFDFANSSYSALIMTLAFPVFFKEAIAGQAWGDLYWGIVLSLSVLLGGLAAPVVGAMADHDRKRKRRFVMFTLLAVLGTASLYFTGSGLLLLSSILFIATNICFTLAVVLYDSFLVQISDKHTAGRISGLGWGLGYLGGLVAMLALIPWYNGGFEGALEGTYRLTFPLTALFFLVFALPAFRYLREDSGRGTATPFARMVSEGFKRTWRTLCEVRKYKRIAWFFLGFYLLTNGMVTVFSFVPIYARGTFAMSMAEITVFLIAIQLIAFPASLLLGWLSDRIGQKKVLLATVSGWCITVLALAGAQSVAMLWAAAGLAGLVIGSSQAVARSWLSRMVPRERRAEFFGFNGFTSKISATTGPLVFGGVSALMGQRLAMLALLPFFAGALWIFARIRDA